MRAERRTAWPWVLSLAAAFGLALGVPGVRGRAALVRPVAVERHSTHRSLPSRGTSSPPVPADVGAPPADAERAPTGVASRLLKAGKGSEHPGDDDRVTIHFTSWKRDGTLVDGTRMNGVPAVQSMRRLFPGVAAALRTMVTGEQRRLWVPAALTTRPSDDDDAKPSAVDLTIDVELLALEKAPPPPKVLGAPPSHASRTSTGLAYEFLRRGSGAKRPEPGDLVTFFHSGWTANGELFESSVMARNPETSRVSDLVPGLGEGLRSMRVGDRALFWIPASLAYGEHPRRGVPVGPLTFEVELLAVE